MPGDYSGYKGGIRKSGDKMRTKLSVSLKTLFIVIFTSTLISSIVSCGTVPKQVNLSPASHLVMPDEARKIGIVFNSNINSSEFHDFVIDRLGGYLGNNGDFIRLPDNSSEDNILSSILGDITKDGLVDVDELSQYLSKEVPQATGQRQTPVKKGEVEGTLIVGKVK